MKLFEKMRQQKLMSMALMLFTLSVGILIGTLINLEPSGRWRISSRRDAIEEEDAKVPEVPSVPGVPEVPGP